MYSMYGTVYYVSKDKILTILFSAFVIYHSLRLAYSKGHILKVFSPLHKVDTNPKMEKLGHQQFHECSHPHRFKSFQFLITSIIPIVATSPDLCRDSKRAVQLTVGGPNFPMVNGM